MNEKEQIPYEPPIEYPVPRRCEKCGSEDIFLKANYSTKLLRCECSACGYSKTLPQSKNLRKRVNSTLNNMCEQQIEEHPWCQICGSKDNLEAHHIIPVAHSEKYKYWKNNLITLCKDCHQLVHHKETKNG